MLTRCVWPTHIKQHVGLYAIQQKNLLKKNYKKAIEGTSMYYLRRLVVSVVIRIWSYYSAGSERFCFFNFYIDEITQLGECQQCLPVCFGVQLQTFLHETVVKYYSSAWSSFFCLAPCCILGFVRKELDWLSKTRLIQESWMNFGNAGASQP